MKPNRVTLSRFIGISALVILAGGILSGCSMSASNGPASTQVQSTSNASDSGPIAEPGKFDYERLTIDDPKGANFVAKFRTQFPTLTGTDRPDKYILKNGTEACGTLQLDDGTDIVNLIQNWVIGGDQTRKATPAEAKAIINLSIDQICPEFAAHKM